MIRDAAFADIPAIVAVLRDAFDRSHYAAESKSGLDEVEAKQHLIQAIRRHGGKGANATFIKVAESNGRVEGVIVGVILRAYGILNTLYASDVFWVASERVDPADPRKLMLAMIEWAKTVPGVDEVRCATSSLILEDYTRAGLILDRLGLKLYGEIRRMEI